MKSDALTHEDRAKEFMAAVRGRLADLPTEEVDELLDGLQADLTERLVDGEELGDPAGYADELRQAAGFPDRSETGGAKARRTTARERWKLRAERTRTYWAATPQRRGVRDFMVSLHPMWWVIRGLVLTWLLLAIFAHPNTHGVFLSFPALLLAAALIIVSVQWGRGFWRSKRWLDRLRKIANVVALVFLIPAFVTTYAGLATGDISADPSLPYQGLSLGGAPIDNIFAYDCEGNPIDLVRLYDENGQPLTTTVEPSSFPVAASAYPSEKENLFYVPNALAAKTNAWNVFPLREVRVPLGEQYSEELVAKRAKNATPPFTRATPLGTECPVPGAESTPDESSDSTSQQ